MNPIDVSDLTAQKLKNKEYLLSFPEYYQLQEVVEIGMWHDHQNVFEHVIKVYENLEDAIGVASPRVSQYLQQMIGSKDRKSILKVATLLHDIAKKETLILNKSQANCPGHEHIAAGKVKHFSERFGLDDIALSYVERIVLHHGFISDILTQVINKPENENQFWSFFMDTVGDVWYELLLLMHADLNGCDLEKTSPAEYDSREKVLIKWLASKQVSL